MNSHVDLPAPIAQRWERPFDFPPGTMKKMLPTKYLQLGLNGNIPLLAELLDEHPEYLNKRGPHNRTFLWEATRQSKLATVQWLVERGAEVDATGAYNGESYIQLTPYCAAIYYQRKEVATYLKSHGTQSDIFRAAFLGDHSKVKHDLDLDLSLLKAEDPYDWTYFVPLIAFAVVGGHIDLVDFLIRRGAIIPPYSAQLLHLAARDSRVDLIELLMANGADMRAVDSGIYVAMPDIHMVEYLLKHGASANAVSKNRFPPLVYLARGDKGEHPEKMHLLLEHGADVNARGPKGKTALHVAATAGHLKVINLLLSHGADRRLRDNEGYNALGLAIAAGKTDAAALLA